MQRMSQKETEEIILPYMVFGDFFLIEYGAYDINAGNEEKRIRIFGTQLMDTVIENMTLENFNWNLGIFFKFGTRLVKKFPYREAELNKILITFWQRAQSKYKQLKEN